MKMKTLVVLLVVQSGFFCTISCVVSEIETIYVCEGEEKVITCNSAIEVDSAKYGRFDRVTCLHPAINTVDCFNDVLENILSKCEGKKTCTLSSSNKEYGDPCPRTHKYLEVKFICPSTETPRSSQEETTAKTTTESSTTITTTTNAEQYTSLELTSVSTSFTTHIATTNQNHGTTASAFLPTGASCACNCRHTNDKDCKNGYLMCSLAKLRQQLTINKTTLSSFKRRKISVYDGRTSVTVIGCSGVAVIVTVLTIIVLPDLFNLIKYVFCKKI